MDPDVQTPSSCAVTLEQNSHRILYRAIWAFPNPYRYRDIAKKYCYNADQRCSNAHAPAIGSSRIQESSRLVLMCLGDFGPVKLVVRPLLAGRSTLRCRYRFTAIIADDDAVRI
jgi:hypothetical protein